MSNSTKTILCVEGQQELAEFITTVLTNLGYEVVNACSYGLGLVNSLRSSFDLYIIASELPDGTGAGLCTAIRAHDPQTPIIFTSGGVSPAEIGEAKSAGVNQILSLPFMLAKFENSVIRLLS